MDDMTLDELARMVADGFASVETRIDVLEGKMEKGFREVHARIDQLTRLHEDHSRRIKNLELKIS